MAFGATDIPPRGVDDFRETLRVREVKLANAKKQRDVILIDIRKAQAAADMGDQRARFELAGLNKQDLAAGRLILSLEAEVAQSRKRLAMAETQAATAAATAAASGRVRTRELSRTSGSSRLFARMAARSGIVMNSPARCKRCCSLAIGWLPGFWRGHR